MPLVVLPLAFEGLPFGADPCCTAAAATEIGTFVVFSDGEDGGVAEVLFLMPPPTPFNNRFRGFLLGFVWTLPSPDGGDLDPAFPSPLIVDR